MAALVASPVAFPKIFKGLAKRGPSPSSPAPSEPTKSCLPLFDLRISAASNAQPAGLLPAAKAFIAVAKFFALESVRTVFSLFFILLNLEILLPEPPILFLKLLNLENNDCRGEAGAEENFWK